MSSNFLNGLREIDLSMRVRVYISINDFACVSVHKGLNIYQFHL